MKYKSQSASLLLCAGITLAAVSESNAQGWNYIYNYQTPFISVTTGLQMARRNDIVRVQNSSINVFSVTQVGNNSNAMVMQAGRRDFSNIMQIANPVSALTGP